MKRKEYIAPTIRVRMIIPSSMIADSGTSVTIESGGENGKGSHSISGAKSSDSFFLEDDEIKNYSSFDKELPEL